MKSRTGAGILLLGVFVLGAVTGAVSHSLYKSHVEAASSKSYPKWSSHSIVDDLAKGLALDAQQKEKLQVIISQSRDRYRALSVQFRPQYEVIRNETNQEIRQILREDQKAQFEKIISEWDSRRKSRSSRQPK
jgi:uncharacterized membrane protein